ncbi:hypothetical protein MSG28_015189 [Choristoneura fumiferana]|uniref:Uncharacterized protein n=1 Tax=Choristoneura fumiferana TaxID=7141 RepID=A0ACC0KZ73_CHOFU|nr:hypothetical protein MSG28_015189 [Choristoneura fumiferana]
MMMIIAMSCCVSVCGGAGVRRGRSSSAVGRRGGVRRGANTAGWLERLAKELAARAPSAHRLKSHAAPSPMERRFAAWIGPGHMSPVRCRLRCHGAAPSNGVVLKHGAAYGAVHGAANGVVPRRGAVRCTVHGVVHGTAPWYDAVRGAVYGTVRGTVFRHDAV